MLDIFHTSDNINVNQQIFYATGGWQTWIKTRGKSMINITVIGGGGGGGAGTVGAAAATTRTGGGGGGSGAVVQATGPLLVLPDILYVQAGAGGVGGIGCTSVITEPNCSLI